VPAEHIHQTAEQLADTQDSHMQLADDEK